MTFYVFGDVAHVFSNTDDDDDDDDDDDMTIYKAP